MCMRAFMYEVIVAFLHEIEFSRKFHALFRKYVGGRIFLFPKNDVVWEKSNKLMIFSKIHQFVLK